MFQNKISFLPSSPNSQKSLNNVQEMALFFRFAYNSIFKTYEDIQNYLFNCNDIFVCSCM